MWSARWPIIAFAFATLCCAQPAAAPPKVLLLARQQYKPGKATVRESLERATAAIFNQQDVPVYWMELAAFTGSSEAIFFDPFDSFEAVERAGTVVSSLNESHPELVRLQSGIYDTLSSQRTILAVRRDSPAVENINLAQARFLRMLVVRGEGDEPPSALDLTPSVVYEITSGMPRPVFLIFQTLTAFTELPVAHVAHGIVLEDAVYAVEADLSHVSRAFAEQDRAFWMKP